MHAKVLAKVDALGVGVRAFLSQIGFHNVATLLDGGVVEMLQCPFEEVVVAVAKGQIFPSCHFNAGEACTARPLVLWLVDDGDAVVFACQPLADAEASIGGAVVDKD